MERNNEKLTFPTAADADGYFYADADDKELGIETRKDGDDTYLRYKMPDGRTCISRELIGEESLQAQQIAKGASGMQLAMAAICTTIDGQQYVYEDLLKWKAKNLSLILIANQRLNF